MKEEYKELFELIDTNKELFPTGDYIKICNIFKEIYKNKENKENKEIIKNIKFSIKYYFFFINIFYIIIIFNITMYYSC